MFSVIVACELNHGIGKDNTLPWKSRYDMQFFQRTTKDSVVIMGGNTYRSIGNPLQGRVNMVISQKNEESILELNDKTKLCFFNNPMDCVIYCNKHFKNKKIFVCGGASIYNWFHKMKLINTEYVSIIHKNYECDTYYEADKNRNMNNYKVIKLHSYEASNSEPAVSIYHYALINHDEQNMLKLMRDILNSGNKRGDRTGTGTISLFGRQLRFDLRNNIFPLMTTRSMFLRGIFEELMFFLRGQTDSKILEGKKIMIWRDNTTKAFLSARGLDYLSEGDMGHSYGFSFRHFGAEYAGCSNNYQGQGYDQLAELIKGLKTNPNGRRHIISLWEPNHMHKAALPPCLYQYQFYVADGMLSCMMTQRSSDFAVAGGWNVGTGALLTILVAYVCDLEPRELIWNLGDVHLYNNVIDGVLTQITRLPNIYPKLIIKTDGEKIKNIEDFEFKNLLLLNYKPQGSIKFPMNA